MAHFGLEAYRQGLFGELLHGRGTGQSELENRGFLDKIACLAGKGAADRAAVGAHLLDWPETTRQIAPIAPDHVGGH
ncbi:MAG: hypothetical protein ACR2HE_11260 [Casimicrobiaceae bacterium]